MTDDTETVSETPPIEDIAPIPEAAETPETETPEAETEDDEAAKRIARLAHDARTARREARQLKAELEVLKGQRQEQPDAEMERRVNERAQFLAAQTAHNDACNKVYAAGCKEYGKDEFEASVKDINDCLGGLPTPLIEAAMDAGDAHKLLQHLGGNTDELEAMASLPPHRMGAAMAKLAAKLSSTKIKAVSKAPAPIKPIHGNAKTDMDIEKMPIEEFMRQQDEHDRNRRYH